MNININLQNGISNTQQVIADTQENTALRTRTEQNRQQDFDAVINNRIIEKIIATRNLVNVFSNEALDKLIEKDFFISETGSWRNRMYYIFKNEQTRKKITADEDYSGLDLNNQVLSQILKIETLDARINRLTNVNNQPNVDVNSSIFNSWVDKVAKTISSLYRTIDETSLDRVIAKGFYLDSIETDTKNIVIYNFKSRNNNHVFYISSEYRDTLTEQLNNNLAIVQSSTITPATAIASVPAAIDTLSEEQISSINSYGYKIIVISKALANLNDEKRNLLIHNIENPYVDNLQLFKEIILESIHNLDNSEQNIISYAHLINDTTWSLVEINTIIRKGILLLDS